MQEILEAIVQGIVQGATEFLPVSSSGHLSLVQHVMGVQNTSLLFNVMLHIGTLAAVLIAYRKLIWRLIKALGLLLRDIRAGVFVLRDARLVAFELGFQVCFQLIDVALPGFARRARVDYSRDFYDGGLAAYCGRGGEK